MISHKIYQWCRVKTITLISVHFLVTNPKMRHISTWHHPILKANHLLHFFLIPLFHRHKSRGATWRSVRCEARRCRSSSRAACSSTSNCPCRRGRTYRPMGLKMGTIQKCSGKILTFYDGINMGIHNISTILPYDVSVYFMGVSLFSTHGIDSVLLWRFPKMAIASIAGWLISWKHPI